MDQFSGVGVLATGNQCGDAPDGFDEYTLVMTGSLEGCLYTDILTARTTPSGVYLETGQEIFVGILNDGSPKVPSPRPTSLKPSSLPTAQRSTAAASIPLWTAAAPAASRVPAAG